MKQLLLVEDDELLNKTLAYNLTLDGYNLTCALTFQEAEEKLSAAVYDLMLLDIHLPDGSGLDLCRQVKVSHPDMLIIFLTANDQEWDQIQGYDAGAVDYITKPFSILALQRKLKAMFHMLDHRMPKKEVYNDGTLYLDFTGQTACLNGKPLFLSALEFRMLQLFCQNPGRVLTRQQLLQELWDSEEKYVDTHTLTTSVSRLRGKIEKAGHPCIRTIYGMGYQWTGGKEE